ncbi:MAG: AAA family ATPase [Isosphaeraceae bacterium]
MWEAYWRLQGDPFLGPRPPFVRTDVHGEAVARVVHAIENSAPLMVVQGAWGVGRSTVLNRAVVETRAPCRRFARASGPPDVEGLLEGLVGAFGSRRGSLPSSSHSRAFAESLQLAALQRLHPVVVIDDAEALWEERVSSRFERFLRQSAGGDRGLTVVIALRDGEGPRDRRMRFARSGTAKLTPLTYSECVRYVEEKLARAGRRESTFEPLARVRLYDLTGGVPAAIDRLAAHAMMAGAVRGVSQIDARMIDDVGQEFLEEWEDRVA